MMNRSIYDRDNVSQKSQGQKSLHTYTPGSHENLIRSHLQLDNERQARLQQEVRRLARENDDLRKELDDALRENQRKDDELNSLRNTPSRPQEVRSAHSPLYELEGKPVTLDGLIEHFNIIIQRHHDLLKKKNQEIRELQDQLDRTNQRPEPSKLNNADIQDLLNEMTKVRKEYEQANYILSDRNQKLERLIDDLEKKLDEYSREIQNLRNELSSKPAQPSASTVELIQRKEEENVRLRELIRELEDKSLKMDNIREEIKNIIKSKEIGVNKINDIINEMNKQPSSTKVSEGPDTSSLQGDCERAINDLNDSNKKLNDILKRLREMPKKDQTKISDDPNRRDIVPNLENVKNQCEEQIQTLKKLLQRPPEESTSIVSKSHTKKYPDDVSEVISRVNFASERYEYQTTPESYVKSTQPYSESQVYTEPPRQKQYATETCEACSDHLLKRPTEPSRDLAPKISYELELPSSRKLVGDDFYPPSQRVLERARSYSKEKDETPTRDKAKKPKKGGCCKKKPSETSTRYEKRGSREKEKSMIGGFGKRDRSSDRHNFEDHPTTSGYASVSRRHIELSRTRLV